MRSSPSKVVRFFPIKIKQNWQQAVPKPDATREKGKWLQTKLPTQKSPYPKQPPIAKRTGYLSHTGDYLTADPKRKRSLRTSPTPIDCKPYSVTRLATLFEPICLEPKGYGIITLISQSGCTFNRMQMNILGMTPAAVGANVIASSKSTEP